MDEKLSTGAQETEEFRSILGREYSPPALVTLVNARNRPHYERLASWYPPPGWSESPTILDPRACPDLRPGLVVRKLGDSLTIHDPSTLDTHCLNETAAPIVLFCNGLRSLEEVAAEFAHYYQIEPTTALSDVRRILGELLEVKALVVRRKGGSVAKRKAPKPRDDQNAAPDARGDQAPSSAAPRPPPGTSA